MMRNRKGFTAIEMAIVAALIGLLAAIAFPRFGALRQSAELNSAKRQLITQLGAARAAAVQRGRTAQLHTSGTEIWLTADIGGVQTDIARRAHVYDQFGVTIVASDALIAFDSRGLATSLPATGGKFVLQRAELSDSVCVTRFGTIVPACGL